MAGLWLFENVTQAFSFYADVAGLTINDERPCQLATLSCSITDPDVAYTFQAHDMVRVSFDGTLIFSGDVSGYGLRDTGHGPPRQYLLTARDITARLSRDVITENRMVVESVEDRVLWIMGFCTRRVSTLGVEAIPDEVDALESKGMTVAQALAATATEIGASYYATFETAGDPDDFDGDLQFFYSTPTTPAPFDLRSSLAGSWNPATDPPLSGAQLAVDAEGHATAAYVRGTDVAVWVEDAGAITDWAGIPGGGRLETPILDPGITTDGQAERVGLSALWLTAQPRRRATATVQVPGLLPMQVVRLDHPLLEVDADFFVTKTTTTFVSLVKLSCRAEMADRFTPCTARGQRGAGAGSGQQPPPPPSNNPPCSDCGRRVSLLPVGMDADLTAARGQAGLHVYDGTKLAGFDCALQRTRYAPSALSGLGQLHHEPGIYTGLLAGDRVFHLDPDLGAYGTTRWTTADTITAAAVMDIRRAWLVAAGAAQVYDTFNDTTTSPEIGPTTRGTGDQWYGYVDGASAPYDEDEATAGTPAGSEINVDGTRLHYHTDDGTNFEGTNRLLRGGAVYAAEAQFEVTFDVEAHWLGTEEYRYLRLTPHNPHTSPDGTHCWLAISTLNLGGCLLELATPGVGADSAMVTFDADTLYHVRWQHRPDGTSQARIWADGDPEPGTWDVSQAHADESALPVADGELFEVSFYGGSTGQGESDWWLDNLQILPFGGLQTRSLVDGAVVAETTLTNPTDQIRRSPNGQHVTVLQDTELVRYNRALALEATVDLPDFYTDLAEWNVDDAHNIYRLTTDGVLERYDAAGELEWSRDLFDLYGYRFPSLMGIANGTGLVVQTADNKLRIVGYVGAADWLDGSEALLLSLHPASGGLIAERRYGVAAVAAQAQGLVAMGACLWLFGATDDGTFEGLDVSGTLRGWVLKDEAGDLGGVVAVAVGDDEGP